MTEKIVYWTKKREPKSKRYEVRRELSNRTWTRTRFLWYARLDAWFNSDFGRDPFYVVDTRAES